MKKLLIASGNKGKIREFEEILKGLPVNFVSLDEVAPNFEVEETGKTFKENAILKVKSYAKKTGLMTIADDSGLEVDALGGKPGVYSARFFGEKSQEEKNEAILNMLKNTPEDKRTARFICIVAVVDLEGKIETTEGIMEGRIAYEQRGDNNFGYDPIFIPNGLDKTNAELKVEEKNRISHRGKALRKAREILRKFL